MPYDPVLGVGREPRVSGGIRAYTLATPTFVNNGGTDSEANTDSVAIEPNMRIFTITIGVTPDVGTNLYCDRPKMGIFIDGQRVKEYIFPDYSQSWYGPFTDVISVDIPIIGGNSTLEIRWGPTANYATGYKWSYDIRAYGIPY